MKVSKKDTMKTVSFKTNYIKEEKIMKGKIHISKDGVPRKCTAKGDVN